jgi:hypothetical protein
MPDSLQSNKHQQEPSSSTTTTTSSSISNHTVEEEEEEEEVIIQDQESAKELPIGYAPPSRARSSKLLHISLFKSTANTDIPPPPLPNTNKEDTTTTNTNTEDDSHLALNSNFIGKYKKSFFLDN